MHRHVELELDFTRRRHWGSRGDELIIAHHSTRFQGCAALLLLMLEAADAVAVSPSALIAAPYFFSYPQADRPTTPSHGTNSDRTQRSKSALIRSPCRRAPPTCWEHRGQSLLPS